MLLTHAAQSRDLFTFTISVDDSPVVRNGLNDIRDVLELFDNVSLKEIFPQYTPNSEVHALLDLRGVQGILSYAASSKELRFALPQLGLDVRFPGGSREESQELWEKWIQGLIEIRNFATSAQLQQLLEAAAKYSPVEPMAGNPNSLQSRMFMADFDRSLHSPRVQLSGLAPDSPAPPGLFNADFSYGGSYRAGSFDVNAMSLSLGGLLNFPNRHWALLIDWPFMGTWTENAESLFTYPGIGVQYRITDWWHVTAFARAGLAGSLKVGALGGIYSGTITTSFYKDFGNLTLAWALLGGFNHSIDDIEIDGHDLTYGLLNYPLQTGLDLSGPMGFSLGTKSAAWSLYANYTHLFGTELFLQDFAEVGGAFLLRTSKGHSRIDWMRLRAGYVFGEDYQGFSAGIGFNF